MDLFKAVDHLPAPFSAAKSEMCTTTKLALHPGSGITFPTPVTCPVNGFGGSWYNQPFAGVPIYNRGAEGVVTEITWAAIDEWSTGQVANAWVTTGACLGLCLATLAYIVALTPNRKKGLPFHTSLLLALVFEIARLLCDMSRASNVGMSPYSAYLGLTNDLSATTYSPTFQGITIAGMVCATLAFFFTVVCFFIQASGLLTGLHMRYQPVYVGVISYLLTASFVAFALRISFTVVQSLWITEATAFNSSVLIKMRLATGVAYAISLGSWCTVSLASVSWLMFTRSKLIVSNRPYDTALTILSLVFVESFVVPLAFLVLQAFPNAKFPLAELVVIPSVLVLLPMGSLFMTVHTSDTIASSAHANPTPANRPSNALPELDTRPLGFNSETPTVVDSYPLQKLNTSSRAPLIPSPADRELQSVDNMHSDEEEPRYGFADDATVMSFRANKIRRALEARSITPVSSKAELV